MEKFGLFFFLLFLANCDANPFRGLFTPLKNDEHPCVAENLKESHRYLCNDQAEVICLSGWAEPDDSSLRDPRNPCPNPICLYEGETCRHGECVRPDVCACQVGWEGHLCDKCVPLPGCEFGSCENAFECNCLKKDGVALYEGAFCDQPACPNCDRARGQCFEPNVCTCHEGWTGHDCRTCVRLPGCLNGVCEDDRPNTCKCLDGWTGHLCDQPVCLEGCHETNGFCEEPHTCLCKTGWSGRTCDQCVSYWQCPSGGTCVDPNQCICDADALGADTHGVCNRENINGPKHEEAGRCSNPCKENPDVPEGPGERVRRCRWSDSGDCEDIVEECFGEKDWIINLEGEHQHDQCIHVSEPAVAPAPAPVPEPAAVPAPAPEPEPAAEDNEAAAATTAAEPAAGGGGGGADVY